MNDPALAKRGEIEDGTKKAFLTSDARMGILSHMLNHGYLAQTLRRPLPTKDGGNPAHRGRRGQLYCRIIGRSATEPLGPHYSTPPGYGGPIRDQPPARTRPVLRSAAQSQNAHLNIVVSLSKLHSKQLRPRPFETRTMARQCYAFHKRNGRRVSSAASKPSSHARFALLRVRSRADARFAVSRSPNLGTGPEGRWLLGALGFGQSGLCENLH